jgi:ribosomal protein S18 acetylase RimI-like enzyme
MSTPSAKAPPSIRPAQPSDRQRLHKLVKSTEVFSAEEITCASELIDLGLDKKDDPEGYKLLVAELPEDLTLAGYVCYGHTPFTRSGWDLYWLATHPELRRRGVGRTLCTTMEEIIGKLGGTHIRVETSGTKGYGAARDFYERAGYALMARIPDFYKPGDDLFTFLKRL